MTCSLSTPASWCCPPAVIAGVMQTPGMTSAAVASAAAARASAAVAMAAASLSSSLQQQPAQGVPLSQAQSMQLLSMPVQPQPPYSVHSASTSIQTDPEMRDAASQVRKDEGCIPGTKCIALMRGA